MKIESLDGLLKLIPSIKKPSYPLSFKDKLKWTAVIIGIYFTMFSIPAFGVNSSSLNSSIFQVINIIFAARIGTLVTVGIGPIVLSSIILQMLQGTGALNIDLNNPDQKSRFQAIQKLAAMVIAIIEATIFTSTTISLTSPSFFWIVVAQLALSAIIIIYLDEIMVKYGITSGINLFIAGGVAYAIVGGTFSILIPEAQTAIISGGATAIPQAILAFGPLFFAIIIFLISIYVLDMKIELPLVFSQFRGVGGRLPLPFLYVSVLPVILATSLTVSLGVWLRITATYAGSGVSLIHFFAYYTNQSSTAGASGETLSGGLVYLMQPLSFLPYSTKYDGVGGYGNYFYILATQTSPLYPPWGGAPLLIPEWVHFLIYMLILVVLCVIFGKFWVEMTGQSPKHVAGQLQEVGWQIPGFRRDPRMIESILQKYLPTITVLGSIAVGLLAAFASLTGAMGNGMGILLTAGIMYGIYQQLKSENMIESYPALDRLLS
ncbi:MAG: preprotein translocase subunit SecY [Candidatus Micrarchaeia archaeon]